MNTNWDYILKEDEYSRVIFRVYPKQTNIHSFGENPPKDWKDVYKVYYTWGIICQEWYDEDKIESERIFYMPCDECSNVVNLHRIIRHVVDNQEEFNYPTFGYPAGDWRIEIRKGKHDWNDESYEHYNFQVFDNSQGNGFRFVFNRKQTEDFADWLEKMNDRALVKCGCPI